MSNNLVAPLNDPAVKFHLFVSSYDAELLEAQQGQSIGLREWTTVGNHSCIFIAAVTPPLHPRDFLMFIKLTHEIDGTQCHLKICKRLDYAKLTRSYLASCQAILSSIRFILHAQLPPKTLGLLDEHISRPIAWVQ